MLSRLTFHANNQLRRPVGIGLSPRSKWKCRSRHRRHTAVCSLIRAGVDLNTIRAWLGHVSLETTNIYAEIDVEMKVRAMALCDAVEEGPTRPWREDRGVMAFLRSL